MIKTAVILEQGLCFVCSEETKNVFRTSEFECVPCHKDCWDQACCSLMKFPEGRISDKRFQKLTGIDISYVCYTDADGTKEWWLGGKLHREDGPAYEWADGSKIWFLGGKLHREGGPAYEWANGTKEWYLDDKCLSQQEHAEEMKRRRR